MVVEMCRIPPSIVRASIAGRVEQGGPSIMSMARSIISLSVQRADRFEEALHCVLVPSHTEIVCLLAPAED